MQTGTPLVLRNSANTPATVATSSGMNRRAGPQLLVKRMSSNLLHTTTATPSRQDCLAVLAPQTRWTVKGAWNTLRARFTLQSSLAGTRSWLNAHAGPLVAMACVLVIIGAKTTGNKSDINRALMLDTHAGKRVDTKLRLVCTGTCKPLHVSRTAYTQIDDTCLHAVSHDLVPATSVQQPCRRSNWRHAGKPVAQTTQDNTHKNPWRCSACSTTTTSTPAAVVQLYYHTIIVLLYDYSTVILL